MAVVAIVDTGVNLKHQDIIDHLWRNSDEISGNGKDDDGNGAIDDVHGFDTFRSSGLKEDLANNGDPNGHGTHVAGIVTSLAPKARILPIRMLDDRGNGVLSDALFAWSYAMDNGVKVINNSFGVVGPPPSEFAFMEEAIRIGMKRHRVVFISASGNDANNNDIIPSTPANVPGMISVGATSSDGSAAPFSNYGSKTVDLFAPGENILSSNAFSLTERSRKSGTSQAAPMVTAFAANVLLKKPNAQPLVVEKLLFKKAKTSPQLVRKSSTGGALAGKYVIPSVLAPDTSMSRRLARGSTDPLINYGRFIGVVDDTHGMSQQDVAAQLNCNFTNDVEDIKWPFENIAVFSLGEKAQSRARSIDKAKHRVFAEPLKAANILDEVKGLNLFQTVEWDAFVSLSNSDF
ncbi:S8 family serine peptidase [Synechococcus sp. KORDI-100]|uniref:S8 family serine peptidase n=1 Tax=Synechococcus sp. KORDI-100 TaxID=1280380 RepID=UPI0008FFB33F|nr:S8 family serine peptidase [Synechococcus sp. KORDI-100]